MSVKDHCCSQAWCFTPGISGFLGELDKRVVSSKLALHYVVRPCLKTQRKIRGGERGRRGRGEEKEEEEMA